MQFIQTLLLILQAVAVAAQSGIPPHDKAIDLGKQQMLYLKWVRPGTFQMGSESGSPLHEKDEAPRHAVTISKGFYIGVFEVTQAQWEIVMGQNPAIFRIFETSPAHPVEYVSWDDTQQFISKLNERGIGKFRLPTEAEWEYACRAGTTTAYHWGEEMAKNGESEYSWANSRSHARTNPVGTKLPNPWGLYDMTGNVWEWCQDWYAPYAPHAQTDPKGPEAGKLKVFRGGSWYDFREAHRSANRHKHAPNERYTAIGFRLVWEER